MTKSEFVTTFLLVYILAKHDYRVFPGTLFQKMLDNHLQTFYTAKVWDKVKAFIFVSSPLVCPKIDTESIALLPEAGRIIPEYNDSKLRERICGNYRIVYRLKNDTVEIAAVCHGSRLLERLL